MSLGESLQVTRQKNNTHQRRDKSAATIYCRSPFTAKITDIFRLKPNLQISKIRSKSTVNYFHSGKVAGYHAERGNRQKTTLCRRGINPLLRFIVGRRLRRKKTTNFQPTVMALAFDNSKKTPSLIKSALLD